MSRGGLEIVLLAVLLAPAGELRAGCCPEPSALDRDAEAEALRVQRDDAAGELVLTWQALGGTFRLSEGDLLPLHLTRMLDLRIAAEVSEPMARVPLPVDDTYFLVASTCGALRCSAGRDSSGRERAVDLDCLALEDGALSYSTAACLSSATDRGVVRSPVEYERFADCHQPGDPWLPAPPAPGEMLVWATDYSSAACGTCLEVTCARLDGTELVVETAGGPWGDCDAIHHGGAWARVPEAATVRFEHADEIDPPWPYCD